VGPGDVGRWVREALVAPGTPDTPAGGPPTIGLDTQG
jgi:hypothetical protein